MARDGDREGELALPAVGADQPQEEQQRLLDRDLARLLVDQEEPLAGPVEDDAEVGADRRDEPLRLADRLPQPGRRLAAVRGEAVRADRLHPERPEQQRQHVRGGGVAVVDHEPVAAGADRLHVEAREQVLRVALAHAGRIA